MMKSGKTVIREAAERVEIAMAEAAKVATHRAGGHRHWRPFQNRASWLASKAGA